MARCPLRGHPKFTSGNKIVKLEIAFFPIRLRRICRIEPIYIIIYIIFITWKSYFELGSKNWPLYYKIWLIFRLYEMCDISVMLRLSTWDLACHGYKFWKYNRRIWWSRNMPILPLVIKNHTVNSIRDIYIRFINIRFIQRY